MRVLHKPEKSATVKIQCSIDKTFEALCINTTREKYKKKKFKKHKKLSFLLSIGLKIILIK